MGSYCNYCGQRCFVVRVIPDGAERGRSLAMATCPKGMEHDRKATGHTHLTALHPVTQADLVAALAAGMRRIRTRDELVRLARGLKVRPDWHEPDEQGVTAQVSGASFDNAGFWGAGATIAPEALEMWVTLYKDGRPVAEVNLATLFAWACGYQAGPAPMLDVNVRERAASVAKRMDELADDLHSHAEALRARAGGPEPSLHEQRLQAVREGSPAVQDGPYAYLDRDA
jgi:hypothetical protein